MIKKANIRIVLLLIFAFILTSCTVPGKHNEGTQNDDVIVNNENDNILNLGLESVDTLNPVFTTSASVYNAMQFVFEPLFSFDEKLNPVSVLAESCIASEDFYKYTIKIREGVLWHDQTPFSSIDVLHTINLIRYNNSPFSKSISCISSVTAPDNNTLVIGLKRPVPNFTALLYFPIVQNSVAAENIPNYIPVGTGAYRYDGKISSDKIRLVKNENWYSTQPAFDEIRLNILKNKTAVSDSFNASEIDVITSQTMDLNTTTPRGEVYTKDYISNNMVFLGMNNSNDLLRSANTRKAIAYLIDREDIVTTEIFSRAKAVDYPVNPSAWYYPQKPAVKFDESYVTDMLTLDGWSQQDDGNFIRQRERYNEGEQEPVIIDEKLKLDILVNDDNEERYRIANKIGDALNNFGIETVITLVSFEDYTTRINEKNYTLFIGEMTMPYNMDQYSLLCDASNYFACSSQAIGDAVYRLGLALGDEQDDSFIEFAKVFDEEMPFVPLFFRKESVIFENSLSGTSEPTMFNVFSNTHNWYITQKNSITN